MSCTAFHTSTLSHLPGLLCIVFHNPDTERGEGGEIEAYWHRTPTFITPIVGHHKQTNKQTNKPANKQTNKEESQNCMNSSIADFTIHPHLKFMIYMTGYPLNYINSLIWHAVTEKHHTLIWFFSTGLPWLLDLASPMSLVHSHPQRLYARSIHPGLRDSPHSPFVEPDARNVPNITPTQQSTVSQWSHVRWDILV